jgi:(p)ppGpp synthase/HD superfamily hydrolase
MNQSDLNTIFAALKFACDKHRLQKRKDGQTPYINHPVEVASILVSQAGVTDAQVLAAAILHDTVEDTDTTLAELAQEFGQKVSSLVAECSDDKSLPKSERKKKQIEDAPHKSPEAKLIKIADKTSNVRSMGKNPPLGWSDQLIADYLNWTEQVVARLCPSNQRLLDFYYECLAESRAKLSF